MIWKAPAEPGREDLLREHLIREILYAIPRTAHLSEEAAQAVCDSVLAFYHERREAGLLDARYLAVLTARALCGIGETEAARSCLAPYLSAPDMGGFLRLLSNPTTFSPPVWDLLAGRFLRPREWLCSAEEEGWVITFRFEETDWASGELLVYPVLRRALECLAPVWDECRGAGAVGLRALVEPGRPERRQQLAAERLRYAQAVLEQTARRRGWAVVPRILLLHG